MKERYEAPAIETIGSIQELTLSDGIIDKCGGSGDLFAPLAQTLDNRFAEHC